MHGYSISLAIALLLAGLALSSACRRSPEAGAQPNVTLVVSGDTAGWIMPCGCSARQSGGLARRATYIETFRRTGQVVVADVGGAPSGTSPYDVAKFVAILRGEMAMGLAAHNIGAREAELGTDRLRNIARDTSAPLISANVRDLMGHAIAPDALIVKAGNLRLALVGVLSPTLAGSEVLVGNPAEAVLQALEKLSGQYDQVAVLAYMPLDELEELARSLPEVDLVVGGPTTQSVEPRRVGTSLLAAVTNKGKFVARFDAPKKAQSAWQGSLVEMDPSLVDDTRQTANLRQFQQELSERDFAATESSFAPVLPATLPEGYRLAGSQACQECHDQDCRSWEASSHASAWQTLVARQANADPFCQQCHSTGYGLPGGFVSAKRSPDRVGVGCESCHGPAMSHTKQPQSPTTFTARDQCILCHDRENSPEFTYDDYWQRVLHGTSPIRRTSASIELSPEATP